MISQTWSRRVARLLGTLCALAPVSATGRAADARLPAYVDTLSSDDDLRRDEFVAVNIVSTAPPSYRGLAVRLGLGTRRAASHLLVRPPAKDLTRHAPGKAGRLIWPVEGGAFVRGFGFVRKEKKRLPHLGVDIAAKTGTPIRAAADGVVAYASDEVRGYGNLAMLVHADGAVTSYAHCSRLLVEPGQPVRRGEVIAEVGSTGISKGPHLHFEYRLRGRPRSPMARFERTHVH